MCFVQQPYTFLLFVYTGSRVCHSATLLSASLLLLTGVGRSPAHGQPIVCLAFLYYVVIQISADLHSHGSGH